MVLFSRENIALPDQFKGQLIYKHPDLEIRKFTHVIVEPDYFALFTLQGQPQGLIDQPGRYELNATELPFLGMFVDFATGNNRFKAELYFISKRQHQDRFGGKLDQVEDPISGNFCDLVVRGNYMYRITDPWKLFDTQGSRNVPDNDEIQRMMYETIVQNIRENVVKKVMAGEWKVFGISQYARDIKKEAIDNTNADLANMGLTIVDILEFIAELSPDSQGKLDKFYERRSQAMLAAQAGSNYERAAAAELQYGASQGMQQGGGGAMAPAFWGMGMQMGNQAVQPAPAAPATAPSFPGYTGFNPQQQPQVPAAAIQCPSCGAQNAPGAKFCAGCGTAMAPAKAACASCSTENETSAKFCANCGTAMAPAPAAPEAPPQPAPCAGCGTLLTPGTKFCPTCGRASGA